MTIENPTSTSSLPRTERPDAPAYLTRHQARRTAVPAPPDEHDESVPLYLRPVSYTHLTLPTNREV